MRSPFRKRHLWRAAIATVLSAVVFVGFAAAPAQAEDPDYGCCDGSVYTAADTPPPEDGTIGAANTSGADLIVKYYVYMSVDNTGHYHFWDLKRIDRYEWKRITADGSIFIRFKYASGTLRRDGVLHNGILAHNANAQARLFPFGSGSSNNVYQKSSDASWVWPGTSQDTRNFTTYPWQFSDTRWIRDTSKWTIRLPSNEKFSACGCGGTVQPPTSNGANQFTFTTITSYQK